MSKLSHNLSEYASVGDSVSLACLGEKPFHITGLEPSDYDNKKGFKISTKESFEGKTLELTDKAKQNMTDDQVTEFKKGSYNKFHTTRFAVVNLLGGSKIQEDIQKGEVIGPVKCHKVDKPKRGGNPYWELIEA